MIGKSILLVNILQLKGNLNLAGCCLRLNVPHLICLIVRRKETISSFTFDGSLLSITVKN